MCYVILYILNTAIFDNYIGCELFKDSHAKQYLTSFWLTLQRQLKVVSWK
jgi:hypothetical protein